MIRHRHGLEQIDERLELAKVPGADVSRRSDRKAHTVQGDRIELAKLQEHAPGLAAGLEEVLGNDSKNPRRGRSRSTLA